MLEFASGGTGVNGKKDIFEDGLARIVAILEQAHKQAVIYIDVPGLPFMPFDCNKRIRLGGLSPVCAIDREYALQQQRDYREVVPRVRRDLSKTLVFDPVDYLCPLATSKKMPQLPRFSRLELAGLRLHGPVLSLLAEVPGIIAAAGLARTLVGRLHPTSVEVAMPSRLR